MNNGDGFPGDKRKEPRLLDFMPIEFIMVERDAEILKGVIVSLSHDGMSIFSYVPLSEGEKIKIISPFNIPHQNSVVMWVKKYLDDFFMVGLTDVQSRTHKVVPFVPLTEECNQKMSMEQRR